MFTKKLLLVTTIIVLFFFVACSSSESGGDDASTDIRLSGQLDTESSQKSASRAGSPVDADTIWALPVGDGLQQDMFAEKITAEIATDGSFSFTVPAEPGKKKDWILVLVDSTVADTATPDQKLNKICGYLALGDISDNLIRLPLAQANNDINMGQVSEKTNAELGNSNALPEQEVNFELSLGQLQEMARTDNLLKLIRTLYANYDSATAAGWEITITYMWDLSGHLNGLKDTSIDPATFLDTGVTYNLDFETEDASYGSSVSNGNLYTYFIAPESITTNGTALPDPNDIHVDYEDNQTHTDGGNNTEAFTAPDSSRFSISYIDGEPAQGIWYLMSDTSGDYGATATGDNILAVLDMANADPIITESGTERYQIYVPVPQINTDTSDNLESVTINWYLWQDGSYQEISDTTVMADIIDNVYISLNNAEDGAPDTSFDVTSTTWDVSSSGLAWSELWKIAIDYEAFNNQFRFEVGN